MVKTILSLNSMEFKMMSETHLKLAIANGWEINLTDKVSVEKPSTTHEETKVSSAVANKNKSVPAKADSDKSKSTTRSSKGKKQTASKEASKAISFGNVKKGDYFKVYNLKDKNNPKVVNVGFAKEIESDGTIIVYANDNSKKMFAQENCVAISKKDYHKLQKSLAKNKPVKTGLKDPKIWKLVYALMLLKQNKISEADFAKAKEDDKFSSELYHKFKAEVKADNEVMQKLYNESCKAQA